MNFMVRIPLLIAWLEETGWAGGEQERRQVDSAAALLPPFFHHRPWRPTYKLEALLTEGD
jgi:hypothetical protein